MKKKGTSNKLKEDSNPQVLTKEKTEEKSLPQRDPISPDTPNCFI